MIELKPCPFCGEEAVIRSTTALNGKYSAFYIKCSSCEIQTLSYVDTRYDLDALKKAIETWNLRVNDDTGVNDDTD